MDDIWIYLAITITIFFALIIYLIVLKLSHTRMSEQNIVLSKNNEILKQNVTALQEFKEQLLVDVANKTKDIQNTNLQLEFIKTSKKELSKNFEELATKIFHENSNKFSALNKEKLTEITNPFKEKLTDFKKSISDMYLDESKQRSMLKQELIHLKELNMKISEEAHSLTTALKGENKTQGTWGEMILQKVLENSGLKEGVEFEVEVSLKNEEKTSYRPDVVINLPEQKHIIIDAKTSLKSYEEYISTQNKDALKSHLDSVKNHIKLLSNKNYFDLEGIKSLDFVIMFIPIESALSLLLSEDSSLIVDALKKNIILATPSTLMLTLRVVNNLWQNEKQKKNVDEVVKLANGLYDKFAIVVEDMNKLGNQLNTVNTTYENIFGKLHSGKGSVTSRLERFKELGINSKKEI